jgi:phosphoinositide-3-kinase regulatory subunit 4
MGANLSTVTPSSTTAGVDSYVAELGDVQYEKRYSFLLYLTNFGSSLSSARFLKTIRGKTRYGLVVVKIFVKPSVNFSLVRWVRQLRGITIAWEKFTYFLEERDALTDIPNAFPYIRCIETEKAGYIIRQYLYSSLYDRIRHLSILGMLTDLVHVHSLNPLRNDGLHFNFFADCEIVTPKA